MDDIVLSRNLVLERVITEENISNCFKLRFLQYCTGAHAVFSSENYPDGEESDEYDCDERTVHVLAKIDGKPVGTARVIFPIYETNTDEGLFQMEKITKRFRLPSFIPRIKSVEISRIAAPMIQGIRVSQYVYLALVIIAMKMSMTHVVGITRTSLFDSLREVGVPHEAIAESYGYLGLSLTPVYAELKPKLWESFFDYMRYGKRYWQVKGLDT